MISYCINDVLVIKYMLSTGVKFLITVYMYLQMYKHACYHDTQLHSIHVSAELYCMYIIYLTSVRQFSAALSNQLVLLNYGI